MAPSPDRTPSPRSPGRSPGRSPRSPGRSPRERERGGKSGDGRWEEVRVPYAKIPELRVSLKHGGGVKAINDVGHFREGFVLLAGGNLDLEAFDVFGLVEGDEIEPRLRGVVQEALAALADEQIDAKLRARPPWVAADRADADSGKCTCCRRRKRKYTWNRTWLFFGMYYGENQKGKKHDVFISFRASDTDVGLWLRNFCRNRSMTLYCNGPCTEADELMKQEAEQKEQQAEVLEEPDMMIGDQEETPAAPTVVPTAATTAAPTEAPTLGQDFLIFKFMNKRREEISSSRLLILVLGEEQPLLNPWLLLDCCFARASGVPILPVRRFNKDSNESKENKESKDKKESETTASWRKQLPCAFELGFDPPTAGSGASRQHLGIILSRSVVKGLKAASLQQRGVDKDGSPRSPRSPRSPSSPHSPGSPYSISPGRSPSSPSRSPSSPGRSPSSPSRFRFGRKRNSRSSEDATAQDPELQPLFKPLRRLPRGVLDLAIEGCRNLQRDAELAEQNDEDKAQQAAEEAQLASDLQHVKQLEKAGSRRAGKKRKAIKPVDTSKENPVRDTGDVPQVDARWTHPDTKERVYGVIAILAWCGEEQRRLSVDGTEALYQLSRGRCGAAWITTYGGVEVLIRLTKVALLRQTSYIMSGRRRSSGERVLSSRSRQSVHELCSCFRLCWPVKVKKVNEPDLEAGPDALRRAGDASVRSQWSKNSPGSQSPGRNTAGSNSPGTARRNSLSRPRRNSLGDSPRRNSLGNSPRQSDGSISPKFRSADDGPTMSPQLSHRSRWSGFPSPASGAGGRRQNTLQIADELRNNANRQSQSSAMSLLPSFVQKVISPRSPRSPRKGAEDAVAVTAAQMERVEEIPLAEYSLAALKNLACRSEERKAVVISHGGVSMALKAIDVFRQEVGSVVQIQAACLLRNVSYGAQGSVSNAELMPWHEMMTKAEEELKVPTGEAEALATPVTIEVSPKVRQHLLAMFQNLCLEDNIVAAAMSNSQPGTSVILHWIEMSLKSCVHAWKEKEYGIVHQACLCIANLALRRYEEFVPPPGEDGSDKSSNKSSKSQRSVLVAPEVDGDNEDSEQASSRSAKSFLSSSTASRVTSSASGSEGSRYLGNDVLGSVGKAKSSSISDGKSLKSSTSDSDWGAGSAVTSGSSGGWGQRSNGQKSGSQESVSEKSGSLASGSWTSKTDSWGSSGKTGDHSKDSEEDDDPDNLMSCESDDEKDRILARATQKIPKEALIETLQILDRMNDFDKQGKEKGRSTMVASILACLCNLAHDGDVERLLGSMGSIGKVLLTLKRNNSPDVHLEAMRFLWNMTCTPTNQKRFVRDEGLGILHLLMSIRCKAQGNTGELCEQICGVLRNLCNSTEQMKRMVYKAGFCRALIMALDEFRNVPSTRAEITATLRMIAFDAPPAIKTLADHGAVECSLKVLESCAEDHRSRAELLGFLSDLLVIHISQHRFQKADGQLHLAKILKQNMDPAVTTQACWALAYSLAAAPAEATELLNYTPENSDDEEDDFGPGLRMSEKPRLKIRASLLEMQTIDLLHKVCDGSHTVSLFEGVAALMLNLIVDEDRERMEAKTDSANKLSLVLFDAAVKYSGGLESGEALRFTTFTLKIMSSLALETSGALMQFRHHVHSHIVPLMKAWENDAELQAAACLHLTNLAASPKLRIRAAMSESPEILEEIANVLENHRDTPLAINSALFALTNLSVSGIPAELASDLQLVERVFCLVDIHMEDVDIQQRCWAALRNATLTDKIAGEVFQQDGVDLMLKVLSFHHGYPRVVMHVAGVLRNILASKYGSRVSNQLRELQPRRRKKRHTDAEEDEADEIDTGGGYKFILELLFDSGDEVQVAEQLYALVANIVVHGGQHVEHFTNLLMRSERVGKFRGIMEKNPNSEMLQYQGLAAFSTMINFRNELAYMFPGFGAHVKAMCTKYFRLPIADVGELLLEQLR